MKKRLLFVDDEPNVLNGLQRLLRDHRGMWDMTFLPSAQEALQNCLVNDYDVIVTDFSMPGKDGLALLKTLRNTERTKDIPIVILTGTREKELKRQALELGATDLLNKPVDQEDLLARLQNCLRLKTYLDEINANNAVLGQKVKERTKELEETRLQVIRRLGRAAEFKDNETGMHVIRMSLYSALLASRVGMEKEECDLLLNAAPMHDIGKIGIPDRILLKPGKLDPEEWEIMKTHVTIGADILSGDDSDLLKLARTVVLEHHEKWDGSGYPYGLKGTEISLAGRIVSLCDVFDALTSKRPYKRAWTIEESMIFIGAQSGTHFEPTLVDHFKEMLPEILDIKERFSDESHMEASAIDTF
jgi:putative two-component system response regulator